MKSLDLVSSLGLVPHPEGGYFREIHRPGSTPMLTKGQTDLNVPTSFTSTDKNEQEQLETRDDTKLDYEPLTIAPGREDRRPDGDIRRNCLTSIVWMPTDKNPILSLSVNLSDHVHFYHGGSGFEYLMYDPVTHQLRHEILGPNFGKGHKLQVVCPGGVWKCGRLLQNNDSDFCLIGEAVAPGFDFHDFSWITRSQIMAVPNEEDRRVLLEFLHEDIDKLSGKEVQDSETYFSEKED